MIYYKCASHCRALRGGRKKSAYCSRVIYSGTVCTLQLVQTGSLSSNRIFIYKKNNNKTH